MSNFNKCVMTMAIFISVSTVYAIDYSKGVLHDVTREQLEKKIGPLPVQQLTPDELKAIEDYRFDADTFKVLVVLVDWIDRPHTVSKETIDSLMFSRNIWPGGSVADFYYENSYGQLIMVGSVVGWISGGIYPGDSYDFENLFPFLDPTVDYTQFDGNNDNVVDAVVFVRSGTGEEDSQNSEDIWSFAYSYPPGGGPGPFDGMRLSRWNTSPEMKPTRDTTMPPFFDGGSVLNGIRVFAHELGHNFGLPDLYDYDDKLVTSTYNTPNDANDHPVYDWCVMAYYGYGIFSLGNSFTPSHFCGWSKKELGWIEPIEIYGTVNDLVIYDIETHPESSLYKIHIDPNSEEYFFLEYRNPQSTGIYDKFDSDFSVWFWPLLTYGGDPKEGGLLITHISDLVSWGNDGTPWYSNYQVKVMDAGYNPALPVTSNPEGHATDSAQWWYPWETRKAAPFTSEVPGKELFGPGTTPNSDGYGGPTGVTVRVDSIVGDKLYASIDNPNLFDDDRDNIRNWADNCPDRFNPDQTDTDLDGVGDSCDNCVLIANAGQADNDGDLLGNACDNCPNHFNPLQEDSDNNGVGNACCCIGLTGDINGDGNNANILDLNYIVNFIFRLGPNTQCAGEGDVNGNGASMNILDLNYLVNYIFRLGPAMPNCL